MAQFTPRSGVGKIDRVTGLFRASEQPIMEANPRSANQWKDRRRKNTGKLGELEAREALERRGYAILARNFRCRQGEADLVAADGETLVFVEVKTRSDLGHGLPREAVGRTKQQRLGVAALRYCCEHGIEDRPLRFDVVEVILLRGEVAGVEIIPDAFVPEVGEYGLMEGGGPF